MTDSDAKLRAWAVAPLEIHELPAARGCTYVVPSSEFALALAVGQSFGEAALRVATNLGVTAREIDKLCDARSFRLDSPKSRAPRIAALRKLTA